MDKLTVIPKDKIRAYVKWSVTKIEKKQNSLSVCPECGNAIQTYDLPYGYDPDQNEVVFVSVCPVCDAVLFSGE